ncbi:DUF3231 family protein [Salinithrix halophila]|uniref:DUF3231 family protein n=1 Tax=Salinithrix halophila TaxID=1485204 RepID=A0ABV8JBA8_9BACL
MGILSGNQQKEPMHYGEIFGVWSFALGSQAMVAGYQTFINHAGDQDLKNFLQDTIQNVIRPEIEQTTELLKQNGIALPPAPPERPTANLEDIPPGARFNDPEIAAAVSRDFAAGLVMCSQIMGQCTREDIGAMFGAFHMRKAQYGDRILRMNKEKGWLVLPPMHVKHQEPVHA